MLSNGKAPFGPNVLFPLRAFIMEIVDDTQTSALRCNLRPKVFVATNI
jgi:hypothetical protein